MPKSADTKRNQILEIAKRRFAHYGLAKTTMAEIAKDLAFSKALLYYYFPDKNSLYMAVIEDVMEEVDDEINALIKPVIDVKKAIFIILEKRIEFARRYFYIIEYTLLFRKEVPSEVDLLLMQSLERQKILLKSILDRGVEFGLLKNIDTDETANIFHNACMGMRLIVMKDLKSYFIPKPEEFEAILDLQKKLTIIFIDGLKPDN